MAKQVNPIPAQYHTVTPNLVCRDAARAIEYYKTVFDATEIGRMAGPDGQIMHAELKIGDSTIFLNDTMSKSSSSTPPEPSKNIYLHVYVADADTVFQRTVFGGAHVDLPLQNMFWGDRYGQLTDPFGHRWSIATHVEDVSEDEMARRQKEMFSKTAG